MKALKILKNVEKNLKNTLMRSSIQKKYCEVMLSAILLKNLASRPNVIANLKPSTVKRNDQS